MEALSMRDCLVSTNDGITAEWKPGAYIRKFEGIEHLYEPNLKYNSDNTIQAIWLQSDAGIDSNQVPNVVQYLMKKYAILQLRLGKRGGQNWIRLMDEPVMNFEIVQDDPIKVFHSLISYKYDYYSGPLWKICLVYPSSSSKEAVLIFSIHHAITDAYTNTVLQTDFVQALNKMARKEELEINVSSLNSMLINDRRLPFRKYGKLFSKVALKQITRCYNHCFPNTSFVIGAMQRKELVDGVTRVFTGSLTKQQTKQLFSLCKRYSVTVNSCVVSACSHALVRTAEAKSPSCKKSHEIIVSHAVDLRKFYQPQNRTSLGSQVSIIITGAHVPTDPRISVWESSQLLNEEAQKQISDRVPLKFSSFFKHYAKVMAIADIRVKLKKPPYVDQHFMSTNMGNLDNLIPEDKPEDAIRITDIMRSTNREYAGSLFNLSFHTFRGELKYSLDCFSTKLTHKDSEALFRNLQETLQQLAEDKQ